MESLETITEDVTVTAEVNTTEKDKETDLINAVNTAGKEDESSMPAINEIKGNITRVEQSHIDKKKAKKALKTLLDENLAELINGHPIPVQIHDHFYFFNAIRNDLDFLSKNKFVDYSMLVGVDEVNKNLVIGIIDYIHQYDIYKMGESTFKKVVGQDDPTVVHPEKYQQRFKKAMDRYFMHVPDKLSILPSEVDGE